MAKAMGLIFLLFNVTSAQEVPFGIPQYIQCIVQGLTRVLICVPSSLLTVYSVNLVVVCDGFFYVMEIGNRPERIILVATLITEVLFKQFY